MRNLRLEDGEFIYECDGFDCPALDGIHRIPVKAVLAALEVTYREFVFHLDPRAEAIDLVFQYVYQALFNDMQTAPTGGDAPWAKAFDKLVKEIEAHYSSRDDDEVSRKELLN